MKFWKGLKHIKRPPNLPEVTMQAKEKIRMRDGDAILVMVNNGELAHFSWNMSLPHVEFVKRTAGELLKGAWVGTVSKLDGQVAAMSSNTSSATNFQHRQKWQMSFSAILNKVSR